MKDQPKHAKRMNLQYLFALLPPLDFKRKATGRTKGFAGLCLADKFHNPMVPSS
jgi:hypothetical protein